MFASITQTLIILAAAAGLIYCVVVIVYRLTLHPLAKYPGPFLAKITSLYDTYYSFHETRHLDQLRCQQKYGKVFRYGPNHLIIQTSGALRDIYTHGKTNHVKKAAYYTFFHDEGFVATFNAIDENVHAVKRRILGHGFSEKALHALEPFIITNVDKWLTALGHGATDDRKGWSSPKDISKLANYLTFDVLGDLCFGKSFDMIDTDQNRDVTNLVIECGKLGHYIGNSPFVSLYKTLQAMLPFERYLMPSQWRAAERMRNFASKSLKDRFELAAEWTKNGQEPRKDFVYWLSEGKDPVTGKGYSQYEMLTDLRVLIVAGSDTTATIIAAALYLLSKSPEALDRLQNELRQTFSNLDDIVTGPRLSDCHYLQAVIDETLRLAAPITSSLPREIGIDGTLIDGIPLPVGTQVGTAAYGIHRLPEYWNIPLAFRPERWLPEYTSKDDIDRAKSAFCAFSLGHRGCIGKTMAYNELGIALGRALWKFDVRRKDGDLTGTGPDGLYELQDAFAARRAGPFIEFREHA